MRSHKTKAELIAENEAMKHHLEFLEKRLERKGEDYFYSLIENSLQGIYIHEDHRFVYVNPAYAKLFGYDSPEEALAVSDVSLLAAPADRDRLFGYYKERISGGNPPNRYEFQGQRKDGSLIWLENHVQVIEWMGNRAILSTSVDISERKQAEEALRKTRERFSAIVNTVPVLITYVDQQHRFQFNNGTYAAWFGKEPEEITGKHLREVLGDEAYEIALPYVTGALAGEEQIFEAEVPYKDAGTRFETSAKPLALST